MTDIESLYQRFLARQCSPEEAVHVLEYFGQRPETAHISALIQRELEGDGELLALEEDNAVISRNRERLRYAIASPRVRRISVWLWAVAASILILCSTTLYFTFYRSGTDSTLTSTFGGDVLPGGNNAYITFSDGARAELDPDESSLTIDNGTYRYADGRELLVGANTRSATVHTPIGGQYHIILPDGSEAWLNAASSISYPTRFDGSQRIIETSGEVYLEVKPDKTRPFIVHTGTQRVQVLGTAFNIRAYTAQAITTTLTHGKIALQHQGDSEKVILHPGEQAVSSVSSFQVRGVDPSDYMSWREGIINNKDATLQETCQELERWYGVRFIYPVGFSNHELAFNILNREEKLSQVLEMLKRTYQVDFEIKGKEVIVR